MRKNDMNIAIGIAGLAAAILLFRPKGADDDSGGGGVFSLPIIKLPTTGESTGAPPQTLSFDSLPSGYSKKQVATGGGGYVSSGLTATAESGGGMVSYGGYRSYGTGILEYTVASQATKKEAAISGGRGGSGGIPSGWSAASGGGYVSKSGTWTSGFSS